MRKILQLLWYTDFFTYSCLFSIQSYIKPILISNSNIKCRETSLLDMFTITRMFTAYFFTYMSDKYRARYLVAMLCLLGYCIVVTCITFLLPVLGANEFGFKIIFINFLYEAFESGILPLLETMSVTLSTKYGGKYSYGIMRSALVLGRISGHFLPVIYNKLIINDTSSNRNHFFSMITWATIAFPLLFMMHKRCSIIEVVLEDIPIKCGGAVDANVKESNVFTHLKEIMFSEYAFILISVMFFGVYKIAIVNYQSLFTNAIFNDSKYTAMIYIFRSIPELFTTLIAPFFEGIIGNIGLVFFGGTSGLIKTFSYAFFPIDWNRGSKMLFLCILEIFKAIFCDWICYGSTKLTESYNPMYRRATAQGLFNGFFNGACAFISGIIGYIVLEDNISESNIYTLKSFFFISGCFGVVGCIILIGLYIYKYVASKRKETINNL
ncbi:hypothetical protein H312_00601 [Anncaliia algerae PRA339]|uniref:Major facilitator superfamily associated domain-containing protein n=1 Tax=Anncaliia algerae PRA339 TaxID=1288291 RepID=A0A059F3V1_9MICR|nr:hypothetical protein H312_00601 [Anncaliia algerae PRA339]